MDRSMSRIFQSPEEYLLKEPILEYPDTSKPYVLYTDANKYAWAWVLTQAYEHEFEGKKKEIHHPIMYLSGLFRGSQLNWATLTKEAYAIYRSVKKLDPYLDRVVTTIQSDHLPLTLRAPAIDFNQFHCNHCRLRSRYSKIAFWQTKTFVPILHTQTKLQFLL